MISQKLYDFYVMNNFVGTVTTPHPNKLKPNITEKFYGLMLLE